MSASQALESGMRRPFGIVLCLLMFEVHTTMNRESSSLPASSRGTVSFVFGSGAAGMWYLGPPGREWVGVTGNARP